MVANQTAFNEQDLYSTAEFECAMDHHCQTLFSRLETLYTTSFN